MLDFREENVTKDSNLPEAYGALRDLLERRYSCRAFLPDIVERETIERIVEAAQQVPSWCNAQPWQVVVCSPAETDTLRSALTKLDPARPDAPDVPFPSGYHGLHQERRRACAWQLYDSVGVVRGDRAASARQSAENYRFFGAPQVAIVTTERELGAYGVLDCGAFVTAFMLAAETLGISSIAQASIASRADVVRRHLALPDNRQVVCAISFGKADSNHPANSFRTPRAPVEEVIDWR